MGVGRRPNADGWGVVRGGSYLDAAWGVRVSRVQPADPERATNTTGFRICIGRPDAARFRQGPGPEIRQGPRPEVRRT